MAESKVVREPIGTWWRIEEYNCKLSPVDVVAFTDCFVTFLQDWYVRGLQERREARADYFPTFAEAKAEFVRRASSNVQSAKDELQRRRTVLGKVESLQEPTG
jgi:hypothetical protein